MFTGEHILLLYAVSDTDGKWAVWLSSLVGMSIPISLCLAENILLNSEVS